MPRILPNGQQQNPNHRLLTAHGRTQTVLKWSYETGIRTGAIRRRLKDGETPEQALGRPDEPDGWWEGANDLPYADDVVCQVLVGLGPFTLTEISDMMGFSHQRAKQIETEAIRHFLRVAQRLGVLSEMKAMLRERLGAAAKREQTWPAALAMGE